MNKKHDYALVINNVIDGNRMVMTHYKTRKAALEHWEKYVIPAARTSQHIAYRIVDKANKDEILVAIGAT